MNIFTFVGNTLNRIDSTLDKTLGAVENVATMANESTDEMLEVMRNEREARIIALKKDLKLT